MKRSNESRGAMLFSFWILKCGAEKRKNVRAFSSEKKVGKMGRKQDF